jgi:RimJ/RimL family protein N-acetyltransferase
MNDQPPRDSIADIAAVDFSLGNCQAIQYSPAVPATAHLFSDDYLSSIYAHLKSSLTLERTFCGMQNLSHDAIVSYLASKPVIALVEWNPDHTRFRTLRFSFIVAWIGVPPPAVGPRSAFGAYSLFPDAWGTPEAEVLAMLGLARIFHTYSLQSLYGQRYIKNALTAKFMRRFGFNDLVTLPDFILHRNDNGSSVDLGECVVSRLTRADFEKYAAEQLRSIASAVADTVMGTVGEI